LKTKIKEKRKIKNFKRIFFFKNYKNRKLNLKNLKNKKNGKKKERNYINKKIIPAKFY